MTLETRAVKQTVEVERKVAVWRCDAPDCQTVVEDTPIHNMPLSWYGLYNRVAGKDLHFCCLACVARYATVVLAEKESAPPVPQLTRNVIGAPKP